MTAVIDSHTHVWPPAIAARAMSAANLSLQPFGDGTVAALTAAMEAAGVERSVCLGVATQAGHVEGTNRFVGGLDRDRFIGFGAIHPELPVAENVASLVENQLVGVKVHPIFQGFSILDPRVVEILGAIAGSFAVIVHCGKTPGRQGEQLCTPTMVRELAERLPSLDLIACHFGGLEMLDEAERELVGQPIYLDTSYPPSLREQDPARVRELIRRHGCERVIFGSDWPFASPGAELGAVRGLGLGADEVDGILGGNLDSLLAALASRQ